MSAPLVLECKTRQEILDTFPLMRQLRPHLTSEEYLSRVTQACETQGYHLFRERNGNALIGMRILIDLVHGRHLYIDDLVVDENVRSRGVGRALLAFAEEFAREHACPGLRLCTGTDNLRGKKFYESLGWDPRAIAYKKKLT